MLILLSFLAPLFVIQIIARVTSLTTHFRFYMHGVLSRSIFHWISTWRLSDQREPAAADQLTALIELVRPIIDPFEVGSASRRWLAETCWTLSPPGEWSELRIKQVFILNQGSVWVLTLFSLKTWNWSAPKPTHSFRSAHISVHTAHVRVMMKPQAG